MSQISRRNLLQAATVAGSAAALVGCADISRRMSPDGRPAQRPAGPVSDERRILDRVAFGPAGDDIAAVRADRAGYIARQLAADQSDDLRLAMQLRRLDGLAMDEGESRDLPLNYFLRQLQTYAILKAVYSPNQLFERMVDFWTNHLNIYGRKGLAAYRLGREVREVVRANALGRFHDLILASARSPAMLLYLDNHFNRSTAPNENYAREIMELHTLGVDGGYTQRDVMEVARCFSGWGIQTGFLRPRGAFTFDEGMHDSGEKHVLGHRIASGGGAEDGERVIQIICDHPATAHHIARKLTRQFRGDEHPATAAAVERAFTESQGDIRATLTPLVTTDAVLDGPPIVKRPFDYAVSAIRAIGAQTDGGADLQNRLEEMGQPLFQWPMPDGYPVDPEAWSGTLLARWNFALDLANGQIPGTKADVGRVDPFESILMRDANPEDHVITARAKPVDRVAAALMSPDFMWR